MAKSRLLPTKKAGRTPLAQSLKPLSLEDYHGQEHLFSKSSLLYQILQTELLPSILLWGPAGCGKTSLARILTKKFSLPTIELNATTSGAKELKTLGEEARERLRFQGKNTLLFVDEIHRFNKSQQDVLLPFVEDGSFILIGATTENPSFELNPPLLSRLHVLRLNKHTPDSLLKIYDDGKANGKIRLNIEEDALQALVQDSDGDARYFLNQLELLQNSGKFNDSPLTLTELKASIPRKLHFHDKDRDQHYDLISVFHKSIRASDIQGAIYWLERMFQAGEDRKFILRRMIRCAVEDVGLADPQALRICLDAREAYTLLGSPEGELCIHQACVYLASCPKSNAVYSAQKTLQKLIQETGQLDVPYTFRNAATGFMGKQGYGKGYRYDHDWQYHYSGQNCLPEELKTRNFYHPGDLGFEKEIQKRIEFFEKIKNGLKKD